MTGPLAAVRDFFVAPSAVAPTRAATRPPSPASFAVLGARREAMATASGLVLAANRGAGLVSVWPPGDFPPHLPRTATARRLANRLTERELRATAGGRIVWVALPADPAEAVAAAQRAAAAANAPSAVVLAGPREADLDTLLALQDAVVVTSRGPRDAPVVELAVAGLSELSVPVAVVPVPTGPVARLAAGGVIAAPGLRAALAPALAAAC